MISLTIGSLVVGLFLKLSSLMALTTANYLD